MGHKLELPVGKNWMREANERNLFSSYKIISLHKVGLVSKKGSPWAKDSIDFLASVLDESENEIQIWGVEIKSRVKISTINKEKENMKKLRRKKHEMICDNQVAKFVADRNERYQLLHHSFVYGLKRVALVVGDKGGNVISATVVNFSNNLQNCYEKMTDEIKKHCFRVGL